MNFLTDQSVLVSLKIKQWTGMKQDKQVSNRIAVDSNASLDSGRYTKMLIKSQMLKNYSGTAAKMRQTHNAMTLPFLDSLRILPRKMVPSYIKNYNDIKSEAMLYVEGFLSQYEQSVNNERNRLGDLFDILDYPTKEVLKEKFGFHLNFLPVPEYGDWRIEAASKYADSIRESMENHYKEVLENSTKELWSRIYQVIAHFFDRVSDVDGRIFNSLIEHIEELADTLPLMNIMKDPHLDKIAGDIKLYLGGLDPRSLKEDIEFRKEIAERARIFMEEAERNK